MKKTAIIIAVSLVLSGCAGLKSAGNLIGNTFSTPQTAVECLQREQDKKNVGTLHDIAAATYDAATGLALLAGTPIAAAITIPADIIAVREVGASVKVMTEIISEQKDSACKEIREAQ